MKKDDHFSGGQKDQQFHPSTPSKQASKQASPSRSLCHA
jgi:hypothetical protein